MRSQSNLALFGYCFVWLIVLAFIWPSLCRAQYGPDQKRLSLSIGPGHGFEFLASKDNESSGVELLTEIPSLAIGISDVKGLDRWYEGNFDLVGEWQIFHNSVPRSGYFTGGAMSIRYNFLRLRRVVPFVEAGGGMGFLKFGLADQSDGFNFILQAGGGFEVPITERVGLQAKYRYHHISNAKIRQPNDGINSHLLLFGAVIYLGD
jgi:opacity protein-like surface antigen